MDKTQMKEYIGTKRIRAVCMTRGEYNTLRGWRVPDNEDARDVGYLVEYLDGGKPNVEGFEGYVSWSPEEQFEKAYNGVRERDDVRSRAGNAQAWKARRPGWLERKGMYLWVLPGTNVPVEWCKEPHLRGLAEANGGHVECLPSVRMFTADHKVLTGWLAPQTDMFATDWVVVD